MDINQQAAVCEELLKSQFNQFCSDCPSKIPRWASINFGVFICIRCSGVHRQVGVHISKVKSVNLDKWPAGKIELFQNVSNDLINSYWEKNMPKGYRKPDANASNKEVTDFIEDKYVRKKWANTEEWANDPAWLYENKPKKFQKYLKYYQENFLGGKDSGATASAPKKKAQDSDSDEWVESKPVQKKQAPPKKIGQPPPLSSNNVNKSVPAPDLLSFDQSPSKEQGKPQQTGNLMDMLGGGANAGGGQNGNAMQFGQTNDDGGFGDFQANNNANGGFGDFQGNNNNPAINMQSSANPTNMTQQTINIQNLYQMYNSNAHSANDKYSALDSMVTGTNMQNQNNFSNFGQGQPQNQQQKQPFQPMLGQMQGGGMQGGGMQGGFQMPNQGFGGMQQQQPNSMQMGNFNQGNAFGNQAQAAQQQKGFQPNAFGQGNNMQMPGFGQNAMGNFNNNPLGGFQQTQVPSFSNQQSNPQATFQPSPGFGAPPQQQNVSSGSFGSFQSAAQNNASGNVFANGLVDLSNLGGQGNQNAASGFAFGQSPSINLGMQQNSSNVGRWNSDTFGGNNNKPGGPPSKPTWDNSGQQQKKSDAFNGLVKF